MKRIRFAALLFSIFALAACERGPTTKQIQADLDRQLSSVFGYGSFDIVELDRRGSSSDSTSARDEERRIYYYDVRLRLKQDTKFGDWNAPGVASLVTVLGAGPKGISGTKIGGNKAGDSIEGHGTAIYRYDGAKWEYVATQGFQAPIAPALGKITASNNTDQLLTAIGDTVHGVSPASSPLAKEIIDQELAAAQATIQGRLARLSNGYPVAAGPEGGQYVRFMQALQAAKPSGLTFSALLTNGSVDNLNLLRQGRVPLAMTQSDVAEQAYNGTGIFSDQGANGYLRALASLYPEPLHIIVRSDSSIRSVQDLKGKRIGLGPSGSGTRATAELVLSAHGLRSGSDYQVDGSPLTSALNALSAGKLDAVMQVIGVPADQIRTASASIKMRLLPIAPGLLDEVTSKDKALAAGIIPRGSYVGVDRDVPAILVTSMIVAGGAISPAEARIMIRAIFSGDIDLVALGSAQGGQIGLATARHGISIPILPGAAEAIEELSRSRSAAIQPEPNAR